MLRNINTTNDVIVYAMQLVKEGVNFHPDDDFDNYINLETRQPSYTKKEAELRNALMQQCFDVCQKNGIDIYDTMSEVVLKETGLDKFIPVPSSFSA